MISSADVPPAARVEPWSGIEADPSRGAPDHVDPASEPGTAAVADSSNADAELDGLGPSAAAEAPAAAEALPTSLEGLRKLCMSQAQKLRNATTLANRRQAELLDTRARLIDVRDRFKEYRTASHARQADLLAKLKKAQTLHTEVRGEAAQRGADLKDKLEAARANLSEARARYLEDRTAARERHAALEQRLHDAQERLRDAQARILAGREALQAARQHAADVSERHAERAESLKEQIERLRVLLAEARDDRAKERAAAIEADRNNPWIAQNSIATYPCRHFELFRDLREELAREPDRQPKLLSFGCSVGYEAFDLKYANPTASVYGCDINEGALAQARTLWSGFGIDIFYSTPEAVRERGPYTAITALNVLTKYPDVHGLDDISSVYPFESFDNSVSVLASQIEPGGYLILYNSCYLFNQCSVAEAFEAVPARRQIRNGWVDKYDRSGKRLSRLLVTHEGRRLDTPEWRALIRPNPHSEEIVYDHEMLDPSTEIDIVTTIWRKRS